MLLTGLPNDAVRHPCAGWSTSRRDHTSEYR